MVRNGLPRAVPYEGSEFLNALPAGLPYLHFPMEIGVDGALVVRGNIKGGEDVLGRFVPGGDSGGAVPGRFGAALGFDGEGDHVITDWMGIRGDDPRTVAFWVKVAEGEGRYDTACAVWGDRPAGQEVTNQKWNVQIARARGSRSGCILNTTFGGLWMEGRTRLDDGRWHHVAAVYAGRNMPDGMPDLRLYVDGRAESGTWVSNPPIDRLDGRVRVRTEERKEIGAQPLILGRTIHPPSEGPNYFKGEIDELYVVAGALRPQDIRGLWQHNRFESAPPIQIVGDKDDKDR